MLHPRSPVHLLHSLTLVLRSLALPSLPSPVLRSKVTVTPDLRGPPVMERGRLLKHTPALPM